MLSAGAKPGRYVACLPAAGASVAGARCRNPCNALTSWLSTFGVVADTDVYDMKNGLSTMEILPLISGNIFNVLVSSWAML